MSLRNRAILIFIVISLIYTGLLIAFMFYLTTSTLNLWENEEIERGLVIGVESAHDSVKVAQAEKSLRIYRQLKGLKNLFEWQIVGFGTLIGLVFFAVSVLIISFILYRITRPLSELALALSKAGEGYLDVKIPKPDSEIGQVISAYNEMTVKLKRSRERLKQAERIAAWRDAARMTAHEVRNPLTGIRLSIERLIKRYQNGDKDLPKVLEKSSQMILHEIDTLEKLAKELSDFARTPSPSLKPIEFNSLIEEITSDYKGLAKNVSIQTELDPSIGRLLLDKELMRRALLNLLKNSLEAFDDGKGTVTIKTFREKDVVVLAFMDDGPGIEREDVERIFEPYYTTKAKGTGLGLAVVKQIVNEHGGEVEVESEIGKGTIFRITLPFMKNLSDENGGHYG
jgi:nitrogen fixation/metabolism regulation signal transduction histidine kinase